MQIGQLAKRVGVSPDTIRYYEKEGVLPSPKRMPSRYRNYDGDDITRLRFIRKAKSLGFTLADINELLSLSNDTHADMSQMLRAAQSRLLTVESKLAELTRLRDGLKALIAACPGHGGMEKCPILAALTEDGA